MMAMMCFRINLTDRQSDRHINYPYPYLLYRAQRMAAFPRSSRLQDELPKFFGKDLLNAESIILNPDFHTAIESNSVCSFLCSCCGNWSLSREN